MRTPEVVDFNVTARCNLQCSYCYGPPRDTVELDLDSIERIAHILWEGGTRSLVITGGEPLIREDIVKVLSVLREKGFGIALQTNAMLLENKFDVLQYIDWLCMPLDGSTPEVVAQVRGSGRNFTAVKTTLDLLRSRADSGPQIKIGTVVTQQNIGDLPSIARFLSEYSVDVWKCHEIRPRGFARTGYESLHVNAESISTALREVKSKFPALNLYFSRREDSVGAYLFLFPDGNLLTPELDHYRTLGNILSLPSDFDCVQCLELRRYEANVRAAFLDSFLKGKGRSINIALVGRTKVVCAALRKVVSTLSGGSSSPCRFTVLDFESGGLDAGDVNDFDLVILLTCVVEDLPWAHEAVKIVRLHSQDTDVWVTADRVHVECLLGTAPHYVVFFLRQVRLLSWAIPLGRLLDEVVSYSSSDRALVRPLYGHVSKALCWPNNQAVVKYLIATSRINTDSFSLGTETWGLLREALVGQIPPGVSAHAFFSQEIGNRLAHDLKSSPRSLVNFLICLFAFGDSRGKDEDSLRRILSAVKISVPLEPFFEQVSLVRAECGDQRREDGLALCDWVRGARILLIDDRPESWEVVFREVLGCHVEVAESLGAFAERFAEIPRFDLILLDLYLSDSGEPDGLEVLTRLDTVSGCPPVIVFTSSERFENIHEASRHRCYAGYVSKVFEEIEDHSSYIIFREALFSALSSRAVLPFLKDSATQDTLEVLARRWKTYSYSSIDKDSIAAFLSQFGSRRNAELALTVLRRIDFFDRRRLSAIMYDLLKANVPNMERAILLDFGGLFDSSRVMSYIHGDFLQKDYFGSLGTADSLPAALDLARQRPGQYDTLLFYDDLLGMGNQAVQIYSEWLGKDPGRTVDRPHVSRLPNLCDTRLLRSMNIRHFFVIGFIEGVHRLESFWRQEGFADAQCIPAILTSEAQSCFRAASGVFENYRDMREAEALFRMVGCSLMRGREDLPITTQQHRSLGYGNSGKLFVFFHNVPTCTLTALWREGVFAGKEWQPLFRRREKK